MAKFLYEGQHATEGLLSEAEFHRSRGNIVIAAGSGKLSPGTVLGKITDGGKFTASAADAADGSETANAILLYPVDATDTDVAVSAIVRAAQWKIGDIVFDASVDTDAERAAKITQLAEAGIIVR